MDWLPKDQVVKFIMDHVDMLPFRPSEQVLPFDKVNMLSICLVKMLTIDNVGKFP